MASAPASPNNVPVTLDARTSKVTLPIVGGQAALQAAGAFTDATGGVGGTVPSTLSLTLGAPASFGAFIPGVGRTYVASSMATVTSTAGDALAERGRPEPERHRPPGQRHVLPAAAAAGPCPQRRQHRHRYNNVGSSASPLNLLSYSGPVSNERSRSASASGSTPTTRCARGRTARR